MMAWPQHAVTSERALLAVNEGDTDLWGANAGAVSEELDMSSMARDDNSWDEEIIAATSWRLGQDALFVWQP